MSAPQTNVEKQRRRHYGPLIGISLAAVFGVVLIVFWLFEEAATSDPPAPPEATETLPPAPTTIVTPEENGNAVTPVPVQPVQPGGTSD